MLIPGGEELAGEFLGEILGSKFVQESLPRWTGILHKPAVKAAGLYLSGEGEAVEDLAPQEQKPPPTREDITNGTTAYIHSSKAYFWWKFCVLLAAVPAIGAIVEHKLPVEVKIAAGTVSGGAVFCLLRQKRNMLKKQKELIQIWNRESAIAEAIDAICIDMRKRVAQGWCVIRTIHLIAHKYGEDQWSKAKMNVKAAAKQESVPPTQEIPTPVFTDPCSLPDGGPVDLPPLARMNLSVLPSDSSQGEMLNDGDSADIPAYFQAMLRKLTEVKATTVPPLPVEEPLSFRLHQKCETRPQGWRPPQRHWHDQPPAHLGAAYLKNTKNQRQTAAKRHHH